MTNYDDSISPRDNFIIAVERRIEVLNQNFDWDVDAMAGYYDGDLEGLAWKDEAYIEEAKKVKRDLKELNFWTAILAQLTKEEE